ncbi:MAG: EscU/YscU/HrcU family type III secretion system export apparatus switch protein [Oscillospiraceae bacterium]|jgi:flagellar biosynthesis protein
MSELKPAGKSYAAALKYNPEQDYAPVVVASGHGEVAERIIQVADQNGIPVFRDDSTAAVLTMLSIGQSIPEAMFEVVAGIYVEILKASKEIKDSPQV